uniref:Peptidase S74 domain-containing protein n=1 Tax=uncultured Bacteroidota bacterium TaxID=152509 RepID=A0A1B0Z1S2_9BACT|nr:hypothetical protein [uncultured Bacteroidetes bacterium]
MAVTRIEEGGLGTDSFNLPVTLNGTDGSSTDAGDNIVLDASASGVDAGERLLFEGIPPDFANISTDTSVLSGATLTIDSGATIVNSGTATGFGGNEPTSADGQALGSASLEWSDLYLADGGVVYFGNDQEITLTHSADSGLLLKHTATADDKPINLVLQTGETDMAANDVIGKISFQAPDEGTGTDAILVSAAIQAVAEGNHSSSSNATRLEFMTGSSEAAAEKMTLTSAGILNTTKLGVITDHDLGDGLHIKTADSGASVSGDADEFIIEGSGNAGLSVLTGTSNLGSIYFGDSGDADAGGLYYDHSNNRLELRTNGSTQYVFDASGALNFGDDMQNANLTRGVNINSGGNDDEYFALKSTDVAHGITGSAETDTFFMIEKYQNAQGGPILRGYSETYYGMWLQGNVTQESTVHATHGTAMVIITGSTKSGTDAGAIGSSANVVGVAGQAGDFAWTVDASGNVFYDGTTSASNWDFHDDTALLDAFRHVTMTDKNEATKVFGNFIEEHAQILHDSGVIEMNDDGHHFVNTKGLNGLIIDSIRQTNHKIKVLAEVADEAIPGFGKKLSDALSINKLPVLE